MRTSKQKTKQKYLVILKELYSILKYTEIFSMNSFCQKNQISKNIPQILSQGGVIENIGGIGKGAKWVWKSKEPDMGMVDELVRRLAADQIARRTARLEKQKEQDGVKINAVSRPKPQRKKPEIQVIKSQPPKIKESKTIDFSLFWGMIKFSKKQ